VAAEDEQRGCWRHNHPKTGHPQLILSHSCFLNATANWLRHGRAWATAARCHRVAWVVGPEQIM
jgi:hypothetical protein